MTRVTDELLYGINFDDSFGSSVDIIEPEDKLVFATKDSNSFSDDSFVFSESDSVVLEAVRQQSKLTSTSEQSVKRRASPLKNTPKLIKRESIGSNRSDNTISMSVTTPSPPPLSHKIYASPIHTESSKSNPYSTTLEHKSNNGYINTTPGRGFNPEPITTSPAKAQTKEYINTTPGRGFAPPSSSPIKAERTSSFSPIKPGLQRNELPLSSSGSSVIEIKTRQYSTIAQSPVKTLRYSIIPENKQSPNRKCSATAVPPPEEEEEEDLIHHLPLDDVYINHIPILPPEEEHFWNSMAVPEDGKSFDIAAEIAQEEFARAQALVKPNVKLNAKPKPRNYTLQLATQKPSEAEEESDANAKIVKPLMLSREQEEILEKVMCGESIFYTGSAGTGKSVLLRSIIKSLNGKYPGKVAVTASTGLAACNIGGTTLHRFAGFGLGKGKLSNLLRKIRGKEASLKRWLNIKVLIIDEISMIEADLLDRLNTIAKRLRRSKRPFGGIQLVMCGDFHQLPPVVKHTGDDGKRLETPPEVRFAFECDAWKETITRPCILKEVFRQKGDQVFIDMLNEMRCGQISPETTAAFRALSRPLKCPEWIVPTELFATRNEVEKANDRRLNQLPGKPVEYVAKDGGTVTDPDQRQVLLNNFLAPALLKLKKDAQVICIKNFDDTLVNGSLGQVVDFLDKNAYMKAKDGKDPPMKDDSDYIFSGIRDGTLEFSGAIGGGAGGGGAAAAAEEANSDRKRKMSRVFHDNPSEQSELCPIVRFLLPDGINTRTVVIEPEKWTMEDDQENILVVREQIPLMLAWSLSIHKSQGQTLQKVKVDLKRVFETGQSYVALSRAVSREGLQVLNFDPSRVKSHPKVLQFYNTLESDEPEKVTGQSKLGFAAVKPEEHANFNLEQHTKYAPASA